MTSLTDLNLTVATQVAARLVAQHETIAVSEASAGGLISAALLSVPGASAYFLGGGVIYTEQARETLLGITSTQFQGMRSATEAAAKFQANAARARLAATWGLAETGAAGPSANRYGDPAGHCCLAVVGPRQQSRTIGTGSSDRLANMISFANAALELLAAALA